MKRQIGRRLRAVREAMGMDQAAFANQMGVGVTALGNWERGDRLADVLAVTRLYQRWGWTLEWIYAGSLRGLDYDKAQQLLQKAAEVGAVVGATVAEWPMQVAAKPGLEGGRQPASPPLPALRRRAGGLHED